MAKRNYKQGLDRQQGYLLPPSMDEYIEANHPVRAIDTFVETQDLEGLGFQKAGGERKAGQPAYHPKVHVKLYLYGYLNRVRSSRRLAIECRRNLEVMWLTEGQRPSHQAIADFRKENLEGLKKLNREFVEVCKALDLFGGELVGIDGAFFRGNVAKDNIYTSERLERAIQHIDEDISRYLKELEQQDQQEGPLNEPDPQLAEKLEQLRARLEKRKSQLAQLEASGESQIAEVDADARLLSKPGQGTTAGYNVQTAVDSQNKLMAAAEVVQDGNDGQQLAPMGEKAKAALGVEHLDTVQDGGYFNAEQILICQQQGITPYVSEPDKQAQVRQQGRFTRDAFQYEAHTNSYRCPNQQTLAYSTTQHKKGKEMLLYRSDPAQCATCPLKDGCLPKKMPFRTLSRWKHEDQLAPYRERMRQKGAEMMRQRAAICEHVFGTLKSGVAGAISYCAG